MKKTVSVVGCCMARNIFNTPQCEDVFEVNNFAFQVTPWGLFDSPLNIPVEKLNEMQNGQFEQRILQYNINKNMCKAFELKKSDYIVIDLVACSFVLSEITFDGKKIITRMGHGENILKKMKSDSWFTEHGFSYRQLHYSEVNDEIVYDGLDKFADWLDFLYRREQIIICRPQIPLKYLNREMRVCDYPPIKVENYKRDTAYISNLTDYLIKKLTGCLVYDFPKNMIAEDYQFNEGLPFHFTNMDYIRQGNAMLDLLEIKLSDYYTKDLDPAAYTTEVWVKKYCDTRKMVFDLEETLLGGKIRDQFVGTSISSVYTQPFGKNLHRVVDVKQKVDDKQKEVEEVWKHKYLSLRKDYIRLEEEILQAEIYDRLESFETEQIRSLSYNQDLLNPDELIKELKGPINNG